VCDGPNAASPQAPDEPRATHPDPPPLEPLPDRSAEYIAEALRKLIRVRELISEAYAASGREALEVAALARASLLSLTHDGGIVVHTRAFGGEIGVKRMSNEALDELIGMLTSAKSVQSTKDKS
jgi:hypothetical protein